jgi:hypothetical protein
MRLEYESYQVEAASDIDAAKDLAVRLQTPLLSSESQLIIWITLFDGFQNTKDNVNQLSHNGTNNNFPIFPFLLQTL